MKTFKFIMEMLFGFLAMVLYVLAVFASVRGNYDAALYFVLSAIFFTMQENQVHRDLREDDDNGNL